MRLSRRSAVSHPRPITWCLAEGPMVSSFYPVRLSAEFGFPVFSWSASRLIVKLFQAGLVPMRLVSRGRGSWRPAPVFLFLDVRPLARSMASLCLGFLCSWNSRLEVRVRGAREGVGAAPSCRFPGQEAGQVGCCVCEKSHLPLQ